MYANIIVDISHEQLDKTFQYHVPDALLSQIDTGVMVNIPFGRGNRITNRLCYGTYIESRV